MSVTTDDDDDRAEDEAPDDRDDRKGGSLAHDVDRTVDDIHHLARQLRIGERIVGHVAEANGRRFPANAHRHGDVRFGTNVVT
jgi:hypothetical protein